MRLLIDSDVLLDFIGERESTAAAVSSILVCSSATSAVSCSYSLLIWAMRDSASSSVACAASTAA